MTIKQAVEAALYATYFNTPQNFTGDRIARITRIVNFENDTTYTPDQIRRALRDMKCVRRVNGRYIRKGRRVPPKPQPIGIEESKLFTLSEFETVANFKHALRNDNG